MSRCQRVSDGARLACVLSVLGIVMPLAPPLSAQDADVQERTEERSQLVAEPEVDRAPAPAPARDVVPKDWNLSPATRRPDPPAALMRSDPAPGPPTATEPAGPQPPGDVASAMARSARMPKAPAPGDATTGSAGIPGEPAAAPPLDQEAPAEPQLAARPPLDHPAPTAEAETPPLLRLAFAEGSAELGAEAEAEAELSDVAEAMKAGDRQRLEIAAYARARDLSATAARRLSLSRALAVRAFLIQRGIDSMRMYVRALGDAAPDEPGDRVDVKVVER